MTREEAVRWGGMLRRIDTRDQENEDAHRTNWYTLTSVPGNDQERTLLRRGSRPGETGTALFDVVVCEEFDPSAHTLCLEREHTFDGFPTIDEITLYPIAVPAGQWGCVLENLGPVISGERTATLRVHVPANAPVGEYAFRALIKSKNDPDQVIERKPFDHPVVVLFNPADPEDLTHVPGQAAFDEHVMSTSGLIWKGTASSNGGLPWSYSQFDENVLLTTLDLLSVPVSGSSLGSVGRTSPAAVVLYLSALMRSDSRGVLLESKWCTPCDMTTMTHEECFAAQLACYGGGEFPWAWNDSAEAFRWYRGTGSPFKYGQCWNYSGVLTSSLRTLGIAARPVTNFESAYDRSLDGVVVECKKWGGWLTGWTKMPSDDKIWTFHSWCEAWIDDQWHVADATYAVGPVPVADIKAKDFEFPGAGFIIAEVDDNYVVATFDEDTQTCKWPADPFADPYFTTWIGRRITTKALGSSMGEDITATYKTPETTTGDPRAYDDVSVQTEPGVSMGEPIEGLVVVRNPGAAAKDFLCDIQVTMVSQDGQSLVMVYGPTSEWISVEPGQTGAAVFSVPWETLQPWTRFTDTALVEVAVTPLGESGIAFRDRLVRVRGIPVEITIDPGEVLPPGEQATATIRYSNPLATPLVNARLKLVSDAGLPIGGTAASETILLGDIPPGASGSVQRTLVGLTEGPHGLVATLQADGAVPGSSLASIRVGWCPSDFDKTGFVDTDDFTAFVLAFEAGTDDADV
ncbi:MAG: hypothetical protein L6Q35_15065, partial [Phycisphaerales bacterium]|nr:hypothetical protein [Phycisphaerales bacterium]